MSLEQKQQLLRAEIVEQGEDPQKFYDFWQKYNLDLNDVDLDTLIRIIGQYKQHEKQGKQQKQDKAGDDDDDQFGQYMEPQHNPHSNFYDDINWDFLAEKPKTQSPTSHKKQLGSPQKLINDSPIKPPNETKQKKLQQQLPKQVPKKKPSQNLLDQSYLNETKQVNNITFKEVLKESEAEKRKCLKLQPNILEHHVNVEIAIIKFQQIQEENSGIINKIWKGTNYLFTIKTIGRNKQKAIGISWQVKRTHGDFEWLRTMLTKMYPGHVVPPLPDPTRDLRLINGYQRKLESFLMDCYRCPELRNSKYFQVFLSYSKQFMNFKKTSENSSKPKDISHILNMNGEVELLYGEKIDQYSEGLQLFLTKSSQHLKNVKSIISQINVLYDDVSVKYKELSDVLMVMSSESFSFSEEECYPKLTQTYSQISNLIAQHSEFCLEQKGFIQAFMHSHFAYEKDRIDNMQNLITKRKTYTSQFSKPKHQTGKIQSSGSMFSKISSFFGEKSESVDVPSSNTQILKDQVGFFNSQLMKESIRCVEAMINSHVNHFSMYGHTRIDNVDSMQKIWSTVLVELSKLNMK